MDKKYKSNWNNKDNTNYMTTDAGAPINNDTNSLTVGNNGPTLLMDLHLLEKLGHFNRERIPERVVHAKGAGAHGYFETSDCMKKYTKAKVFHKTGLKIPVFVRFSTVIGSKGSADTLRDPRGFAVKFYTSEGNYDIVGNNMPVFFIRDAIKFPDLIHAFKPSPDNNLIDKNRFWDFISNSPESTHMMIFLFSDLGTIKSFRTMEGFGVNTFIWIGNDGKRKLVKYHWKPLLGARTIDRHEAEMLAGLNPDVAAIDLYDTIDNGGKVQYDLYVQLMDIEERDSYKFNPEDATKTWPEDILPLMKVGRMTLDKNPDSFFQETEQSAFCPANLVPGVELSDDKLLQGRALAYNDTQFHRIGPNFKQLPINAPKVKVNNNQQEGSMRYFSKLGKVNYTPNSLDDGNPKAAPVIGKDRPIFIEGCEIRESIKKTDDFYQAGEKYRSFSKINQDHLVGNLIADLWSVEDEIKKKAVSNFMKADKDLGRRLMEGLYIK